MSSTGFDKRLRMTLALFLIGITILFAGCSQETGKPGNETLIKTATLTASPAKPTDTQVSLYLSTITPTTQPELSPTPSAMPATPVFSVLPDESRSINAWRPPVYPVPWIPSSQDHFYFTNPIAAFDIDEAYSTYSYGDVFFENVVHTGVDIPGDIGTPILAAGDGKVIYAGQGIYRGGENIFDDPYGQAIVIEHSFGHEGEKLYTLYAHLDEILVEVGDSIQSGQKIGLMGDTGKTTGPHLHFEVRVGKNEYFSTRNPNLWISPPIGWGILVGQILTYEGRFLEQQIVYLYRSQDQLKGDEVDDILWIGKSYQNEAINSDPYYIENLTISNIPAGSYTISIPVTDIGYTYTQTVEIQPGQVTFIKFHVWRGFSDYIPPTPTVLFSPSP